MTLKYRPGRNDLNPADYVSRQPQDIPKRENAAEAYVNYVRKNAVPKSMTLEEVRRETQKDFTMRKLAKAIQTIQWTKDLTDYVRFKDEPSVSCGVILRDHRLIIHDSLRKKVVEIAHASHQGIVKTKQLVRAKVWFPGIDKKVEQAVKSCIQCLACVPSPAQREPLSMTTLPSGPWMEVAVDLAGPFPSGEYLLVVIDEYNRFPEVDAISSTSAKIVIPHLDMIFSRHGIPDVVKTDNGPPFSGNEFQTFSKDFGFHHRKITPLWPEANGEAERFMATLNKHVRAATAENSNWKYQLPQFLRHYRATPHSSTHDSPLEAFTGRKMRVGLPERPLPHSDPSASLHSRMVQNDKISRQKMKDYADTKRHAKLSDLIPDDHVLVNQSQTNKLKPLFNPKPYIIVQKKGSMITTKTKSHRIVRNSSHFRRIPKHVLIPEEEEEEEFLNPEPVPLVQTHCSPRQTLRSPRSQVQSSSRPQASTMPRSRMSTAAATPTNNITNPTPAAQRPVRVRKAPAYLSDYVVNS